MFVLKNMKKKIKDLTDTIEEQKKIIDEYQSRPQISEQTIMESKAFLMDQITELRLEADKKQDIIDELRAKPDVSVYKDILRRIWESVNKIGKFDRVLEIDVDDPVVADEIMEMVSKLGINLQQGSQNLQSTQIQLRSRLIFLSNDDENNLEKLQKEDKPNDKKSLSFKQQKDEDENTKLLLLMDKVEEKIKSLQGKIYELESENSRAYDLLTRIYEQSQIPEIFTNSMYLQKMQEQENIDQEENSNQENSNQDNSNQDNSNQENSNQEKSNQDNSNQDNSNQDNSNQENLTQKTIKQETNQDTINNENTIENSNQENSKLFKIISDIEKNSKNIMKIIKEYGTM